MSITVKDIIQKKSRAKITMLTCYDYAFAGIVDKCGIDIILVGDSMANVVLGLEETRKISLSEMLNHTQAVARAVKNSLLVADMPYKAMHKKSERAVYYAEKFIQAGAGALKIEWFDGAEKIIKKIIGAKIPVMGHIGLTPQTAHLLGGYRVQGKDDKSAGELLRQARILEDLGVFSLVLECLPGALGRKITQAVSLPTIGIGAGVHCDGQVLVLYDMLGLSPGRHPRFVRIYKDLSLGLEEAVRAFSRDVSSAQYPSESESY